MIEVQAKKLLSHLVNLLDPSSAGDWNAPDWLPADREDISRDIWIKRFSRLAETANISIFQKKLPAAQFEQMLQEPLVPLIIFSERNPMLLCNGEGGKLKVYFWTGFEFEIREEDPSTVLQWAHADGQVEYTFLAPLKADPLVSDPDRFKRKRTPVGRLMLLLNSEKRDIFYIYIYAIFTGLLSLTLPLGVQSIVNQVAGGLILEPAILLITFVILGTAVAGGLQIMQAFIVENIQQRLFAKAAFEFAARIPRFKMESILDFYPPELVNRFFDILTIQKGFSKLLNDFIGALLSIVFGLILLAFYHPFFIVFGLILLVLVILIFRFTGPMGLQTSLKESKYKYRVAHWLEEIARTLHTFKMAGNSRLPLEKMDREVSSYLDVRRKHFRVLITQFSSIIAFKTLITGGLLILGSVLVVNRQITLGQFVASEIVIITVLGAVEKLIGGLDTIYDLLTAVEKIGNVTDIEKERVGGMLLPRKREGISLKITEMSYTFPGKNSPALRKINFQVAAGERIGITGGDGSGKSTLLRVIAGLLDGYKGSIVMDGIPLNNIDYEDMRLAVGDVQGVNEIFEGTLLENLTLGRPGISYDQVLKAIHDVGLEEYVSSLPQGLNTQLLAGGPNLSSGMMKRMILARNILGPPRMLIFTDFFMNLPGDFRILLRETLFDSEHPWTVLASTQDPVFLRSCDRILHLEEGEIVAIGTYEELSSNPSFQKVIVTGINPKAE